MSLGDGAEQMGKGIGALIGLFLGGLVLIALWEAIVATLKVLLAIVLAGAGVAAVIWGGYLLHLFVEEHGGWGRVWKACCSGVRRAFTVDD